MTSQFNVSPLKLSEVHRRRATREVARADDEVTVDASPAADGERARFVDVRGER